MGGSVGGSLGSMAGSVGTLNVLCLVVVLHNPWLRAVTLVGILVKHVAILTVTFLSISVQLGARWAFLIRRGGGDGNRVLQQEQDNTTQVNSTSDHIQTCADAQTHTHTNTHTNTHTHQRHYCNASPEPESADKLLPTASSYSF